MRKSRTTPPRLRRELDDGFRTTRVALLAVPTGIVAGFAAVLLFQLIGLGLNLVFYQRVAFDIPGLAGHGLGWLVLLVPAAGGLIVGLMARFGTEALRGHGIPEAMEAVLFRDSRMSARIALLKPLSTAVAIGTGGPFGAEGPIIQTGGALGSLLGQAVSTTSAERKVLLACGAAGGMAATFGTPLSAIILALELLLFEFRSRSFIPLVIAASLATEVRYQIFGSGALFEMTPTDFNVLGHLPFYLVMGVLAGLTAVLFSNGLYLVEEWFEDLPLDRLWHPALGGLGLGLIGLFAPEVLGVGYDTISDILNARLDLAALVSIAVFKALALLISLGSGTSGGLLAPMFMSGGALGGAFALVMNELVPGLDLSPAAFALVGLAAVFGASARATFTLIVFAFEITRDFGAILPLMIVSVVADMVSLRYMRTTIMTEKLERRGLRIPQELQVDVLDQVSVAELMDREPATVPTDLTVGELARRLSRRDAGFRTHNAWPIVEGDRLVGIVTRGDVLRVLEVASGEDRTVLDAGSSELVVCYPDEPTQAAVTRMLRRDIGRLPVVERERPDRLVGYLGRRAALDARLHRLHEEERRDPGWLSRLRGE